MPTELEVGVDLRSSCNPGVIFYVQAGKKIGMGHFARASAVMGVLEEHELNCALYLDADAYGKRECLTRGIAPLSEFPGTGGGALIIDGIFLSESNIAAFARFYPRILLSPICNRIDIASHILLRDQPTDTYLAESDGSFLEVESDFAFITARHLRVRELVLDRLCVGICLSGGESSLDLNAVLDVVARAPSVVEIRVIDHRSPEGIDADVRLHHARPFENPWEFFNGINVFLGTDGVMVAEAIAQGIPVISLSTPERCFKIAALEKSGALRSVLGSNADVPKYRAIAFLLEDVEGLRAMHKAAVELNGIVRSERLALRILSILREPCQ